MKPMGSKTPTNDRGTLRSCAPRCRMASMPKRTSLENPRPCEGTKHIRAFAGDIFLEATARIRPPPFFFQVKTCGTEPTNITLVLWILVALLLHTAHDQQMLASR